MGPWVVGGPDLDGPVGEHDTAQVLQHALRLLGPREGRKGVALKKKSSEREAQLLRGLEGDRKRRAEVYGSTFKLYEKDSSCVRRIQAG